MGNASRHLRSVLPDGRVADTILSVDQLTTANRLAELLDRLVALAVRTDTATQIWTAAGIMSPKKGRADVVEFAQTSLAFAGFASSLVRAARAMGADDGNTDLCTEYDKLGRIALGYFAHRNAGDPPALAAKLAAEEATTWRS